MCQYCNRGFSRKYHLDRHEFTCKFNTPEGYQIIMQNAIMNTVMEENMKLRKMLEQQIDKNMITEQLESKMNKQAEEHRKEIEELKEMMKNPPMIVSSGMTVTPCAPITNIARDQNNNTININFNENEPTQVVTEVRDFIYALIKYSSLSI